MTFRNIFIKYREAGHYTSLRGLARQMSAALSPDGSITWSAIHYWVKGSRPDPIKWRHVKDYAADEWLRDMAGEVLALTGEAQPTQ